MKRLCWCVLCAILLFGAGICQATDIRIYSIADGMSNYYRMAPDGKMSIMWADQSEWGLQARRSILKFDTSQLGAYTMRGAVLNLWGGRSPDSPTSWSTGPATVSVYHFVSDSWDEDHIPTPWPLGSFLASQVVDYTGYDRQLYQFSIGERLPNDTDGYLSLVLTSSGNNAWFDTRNSVAWNGSKGHEPFIEFRTWSDDNASIRSGDFRDVSTLDFWQVYGPGSFQVVDNPYQEGDKVAELTTGSPVQISQLLDTPQDPFSIAFDYSFLTDTGTLDVALTDRNGTKWVIGQLTADSAMDYMGSAAFNVTDPDWLFLDNATLSLEWDGVTGSTILLDNITFSDIVAGPPDPDPDPDPTPVPEPATLLLLVMGVGCLTAFRLRVVPI